MTGRDRQIGTAPQACARKGEQENLSQPVICHPATHTTTPQKNPAAPGPAGLSLPPGLPVQLPRTREALLAMVFAFPVALFVLFGLALPSSPATCQSSPVSGASRTPVMAAIAAVVLEVVA